MITVIIVLVCVFATCVGSICGMGGGIIIKPVLDSFGIMEATTISFLSGCTVLAMSAYSVAESRLSKKSEINPRTGTILAVGAAVGGIAGKEIFILVKQAVNNPSRVGFVQAICMLVLTGGCFVYSFLKGKVRSLTLKNPVIIAVVGLALGLMSSFLGIGGGPVNVTVLYLLFSMKTKEAAQNSLYIVLFCQALSVVWTIIRGQVPEFTWWLLLLMCIAGVLGSVIGRLLNRKIKSSTVDILFKCMMLFIMCLNVYNIIRFAA